MKLFFAITVFLCSITLATVSFAAAGDEDEDSGSGKALTGALLGGLLGGGVGTAIGSASGHAGTGALVGAGIGAVGGGLIGASQKSKPKHAENMTEAEAGRISTQETEMTQDTQIKKRVIRKYDAQGNVVSEEEVAK